MGLIGSDFRVIVRIMQVLRGNNSKKVQQILKKVGKKGFIICIYSKKLWQMVFYEVKINDKSR